MSLDKAVEYLERTARRIKREHTEMADLLRYLVYRRRHGEDQNVTLTLATDEAERILDDVNKPFASAAARKMGKRAPRRLLAYLRDPGGRRT